MDSMSKIGIIICDRYRRCAGGKCLLAMRSREGAFSSYNTDKDLVLVGFTTCDGCPGGNIEYACEEMVKNGAEIIHLATGMVVGYPPCPYIETFKSFIEMQYGIKVVVGTHPIPPKYYENHMCLGTWNDPSWEPLIAETVCEEKIRASYN